MIILPNVWDSSKVDSNKSVNVEHRGKPLKPDTRYFWKVKIWTRDNKPTEYSDIRSFKTGPLNDTSVASADRFQIETSNPYFDEKDIEYSGDV